MPQEKLGWDITLGTRGHSRSQSLHQQFSGYQSEQPLPLGVTRDSRFQRREPVASTVKCCPLVDKNEEMPLLDLIFLRELEAPPPTLTHPVGECLLVPSSFTRCCCCCCCCCCCWCSIASVVSDSVRPCELQPLGLLCPWDSPVENTRVGCHALL